MDRSTPKQEALDLIAKLPDSASIDEILHQLRVIDKIRKGQGTLQRNHSSTVQELEKEDRNSLKNRNPGIDE